MLTIGPVVHFILLRSSWAEFSGRARTSLIWVRIQWTHEQTRDRQIFTVNFFNKILSKFCNRFLILFHHRWRRHWNTKIKNVITPPSLLLLLSVKIQACKLDIDIEKIFQCQVFFFDFCSSGTNTIKLILPSWHNCCKVMAKFWCMILVCTCNFALSIWSYPNVAYISDANMYGFELI